MVTETRAAKKWPRPYAWDLEKPAQNPEEPNSLGGCFRREGEEKQNGVGSQTHRGACVHPEDWSLGSDTNGRSWRLDLGMGLLDWQDLGSA